MHSGKYLLIVAIDQLRCGSGPRYRHDPEAIGFDGKCRYRTNIHRTSCKPTLLFPHRISLKTCLKQQLEQHNRIDTQTQFPFFFSSIFLCVCFFIRNYI